MLSCVNSSPLIHTIGWRTRPHAFLVLLCLLQGREGWFYARFGFMKVDMCAEKHIPKCPKIGSEGALREPRGGPKTAL